MTVTAETGPLTPALPRRVVTLPLEMWRHPRDGDESVIARCSGPTLDVGCGPGRMAHALATAGVPALGIDISGEAVAEARARGAAALRRDVFSPLPSAGRWHHLLLLDGNIGIGGDPRQVLAQCRESVRDGGTIIIEAQPSGRGVEPRWLRLVVGGRAQTPIPWADVDAESVVSIAARVGLQLAASWNGGGRLFVELQRHDRAAARCHAAARRR